METYSLGNCPADDNFDAVLSSSLLKTVNTPWSAHSGATRAACLPPPSRRTTAPPPPLSAVSASPWVAAAATQRNACRPRPHGDGGARLPRLGQQAPWPAALPPLRTGGRAAGGARRSVRPVSRPTPAVVAHPAEFRRLRGGGWGGEQRRRRGERRRGGRRVGRCSRAPSKGGRREGRGQRGLSVGRCAVASTSHRCWHGRRGRQVAGLVGWFRPPRPTVRVGGGASRTVPRRSGGPTPGGGEARGSGVRGVAVCSTLTWRRLVDWGRSVCRRDAS